MSLSTNIFADSPITSTNFYVAYTDNKLIEKAAESDGLLTKEYCKYLYNKKNDIASRLALINALSWDFEGKSNFQIYLDYLINKKKKITATTYRIKCNANQLICLAYLKAMDDYFDVDEALELAELAIYKDKNSYSIHIIHGLIKAQSEFDNSWCNLFKATDKVRKNTHLTIDMKSEAINIIFEYMDLYADECDD